MSGYFLPLGPLATRLGLPRQFLRRLAIEGAIPCLKIGRRMMFNQDQVEEALVLLAEAGTKPPEPEAVKGAR